MHLEKKKSNREGGGKGTRALELILHGFNSLDPEISFHKGDHDHEYLCTLNLNNRVNFLENLDLVQHKTM
jgi:hypothetical protein